MKLLSILLFASVMWLQPATVSEEGKASYYTDKLHGRKTASGQPYNKYLFTAAHATLPFNTVVAVTNLQNGKTVHVRINDRIPQNKHKIIDVSKAAAKELNMLQLGIVQVRVQPVSETDSAFISGISTNPLLPIKPTTI